ncbi:MAG: hypothetical protein JXX29_10080 [Deltaproteobacteria bacterium]|nr:hypothetical protein [Deltaproteobacteria bacterium]MBN2672013.1 hypothetical protein [Deltaproteobacteria bacterium]
MICSRTPNGRTAWIPILFCAGMMGVFGCQTGFPTCQPKVETPKIPDPTYIRVDYVAQRKDFKRIRGESHAAESYVQNHESYKTVAIRVPEECLNETQGQKEGQRPNSVILNTKCGAHFSEFEKRLVLEGYRVISWDRIQDGHNSVDYDKAISLGVDIIFMVNSLEASEALLPNKAEATYSFYTATATGQAIANAALDDAYRQHFISQMKPYVDLSIQRANSAKVFSSIMDVTAINTRTGETVWFYNKYCYEDMKRIRVEKQSFLFAGREKLIDNKPFVYWWPVYPEGLTPQPVNTDVAAQPVHLATQETYVDESAGSDLQDPAKERKLMLIREVVADFVHSFKSPGKFLNSSPQ